MLIPMELAMASIETPKYSDICGKMVKWLCESEEQAVTVSQLARYGIRTLCTRYERAGCIVCAEGLESQSGEHSVTPPCWPGVGRVRRV